MEINQQGYFCFTTGDMASAYSWICKPRNHIRDLRDTYYIKHNKLSTATLTYT